MLKMLCFWNLKEAKIWKERDNKITLKNYHCLKSGKKGWLNCVYNFPRSGKEVSGKIETINLLEREVLIIIVFLISLNTYPVKIKYFWILEKENNVWKRRKQVKLFCSEIWKEKEVSGKVKAINYPVKINVSELWKWRKTSGRKGFNEPLLNNCSFSDMWQSGISG